VSCNFETDCARTRAISTKDITRAKVEETAPHLRKVDVDAPVVDEDVVHLEVRALGVFAVPELDKRILQRVLRLLVPDDLATEDLSKPRKDQLEVLARRDGVQLAHKEDVLGRCDVGKGQVADHLEREGLRARVALASLPGEFFGIAVLFEVFFVVDAEGRELLRGRDGRLFRRVKAFRIIKGVVCRGGSGASEQVLPVCARERERERNARRR
jgi:hypothetical protein